MLFQAFDVGRGTLHFNPHCHLVADDTIAIEPLDDADPFAGRSAIALDRAQAAHGIHIHAPQLDHVVAAPEELVHPAEAATALAGLIRHNAREIADVVPDNGRQIAMQDGDDHVTLSAVRHWPSGLHVLDFQIDAVLHHV